MVSKEKILNFFFILVLALLFFIIWVNLLEFFYQIKREINSLRFIENPQSASVGNVFILTEKIDSIEIPKIEIEAPLIFVESAENEELKEALEKGVVFHPQSDFPGENGKIFIIGHSAPAGWPKINYDWVFSELNELESGDQIYLNFQKRRYPYLVTKKIFLERGEEIPEDSENQTSTLYLISCWPPGKDLKRIAIEAVLH